jgi:phage-related protein
MNRRIEFESGNEQIQQTAVHPKVTWELPISGIKQTMDDIQAFFDSHAPGGQKFYYTDMNNVQHIVTFATDTFEPTGKLGFGDDGNYGIQGFDVTVTLRKVW